MENQKYQLFKNTYIEIVDIVNNNGCIQVKIMHSIELDKFYYRKIYIRKMMDIKYFNFYGINFYLSQDNINRVNILMEQEGA